ncbi:MAG: helix-turn-helix domain-containing protein [Candidatus Omnitrophica bacterium]|nr:helix-turn-helix domain-containing protein [Candidatus Omnitrophota bacterium]
MKEYYSTVEAAKLCSVTRFSVINWAKKGILKSSKTPGGHRRIHRADLIAFIKTYKIGIDAVKSEQLILQSDFLRCWEFHSTSNKKAGSHNCKMCVVLLSDTKKCYTLREHVGHQKIFCKTSCVNCEYYKKIHFEHDEGGLAGSGTKRTRRG